MADPAEIYRNPIARRRWQRIKVRERLENGFGLSRNDAEKRVELFFSPGFLPNYFFNSNAPKEIANHLVILSEFIDANVGRIAIEDPDGKRITYFCDVGENVPGTLLSILTANRGFDLVGMDSIHARSGYRIVSLQRRHSQPIEPSPEAEREFERIRNWVRQQNNPHGSVFLDSLPLHYLHEELYDNRQPTRIERHLRLFHKALETRGLQIVQESVASEIDADRVGLDEQQRINFCMHNPPADFLLDIITAMAKHKVNLSRTYFDRFYLADGSGSVAILAIYPVASNSGKISYALDEIRGTVAQPVDADSDAADPIEHEVTELIKSLSEATEESDNSLAKLRALVKQQCEGENECHNFFINVLSELFEAAGRCGLAPDDPLLRDLIRFECMSEFIIETRIRDKTVNSSGYRMRHNSARGPAKGGLRIHPIADFTEVAALAFMMTWKCAKIRVKLGGGKGGARLNPKDFKDALDHFHTVSNFGRALFSKTGPFVDVPAGDVNCGAEEIGMIFDGYKAALRNLVNLCYGATGIAARVGQRLVTIGEARRILSDHFHLDPFDQEQMFWLITSERYLSLVLASQITGKPDLGIAARNGATGLGLSFSILAAVGRAYLDDNWTASEPLDEDEKRALQQAAALSAAVLAGNHAESPLSDDIWALLNTRVYPKLLRDKTVVLQGIGKVGASLVENLRPFGIKLIAVADAGGGIHGDLDIDELLALAASRTTVTQATEGVAESWSGREGSAILSLPCDILCPCALENAIRLDNVASVDARIVACGANGPITPRAAQKLHEQGSFVVYDFLANSAGVTASYFEWLRGLTERFRFEAEQIRRESFDIDSIAHYVMPEFRVRILRILKNQESDQSTLNWQMLIRDMIFSGVNDDYELGAKLNVRPKIAGYMDALMRVLTARLLQQPTAQIEATFQRLDAETQKRLLPYLQHPDAAEFSSPEIISALSATHTR